LLIITEKPDAARKISYILSGGKATTRKSGKVSWLEFTWSGKKVYCVGLRGHIVGLDFPSKFNKWNFKDLKALIDTDPVVKASEKDVVAVLKDLARKTTDVIIATDYDREGEFIGVTALDIVKGVKKPSLVKRAKYSSFTAPDIKAAFSKLDDVDYALADAAQGRQIIDLLWGAVLTRFMTLTQQASGNGNSGVLSVGRVQTPTLARIVERELEIRDFKPEPYWQISAILKGHLKGSTKKLGPDFKALHEKVNFKKEADAKAVYAKVKGATLSTVLEVDKKDRWDRPPAPFDTTQFTQEATKQGLTAENAMKLAEELYMRGIISYPRTDNTVYPPTLGLRKLVRMFLGSDFDKEASAVDALASLRPTRGKKQTPDHPPIYPVAAVSKSSLTTDEWTVYELIARRFLATLYTDYRFESTTVKLDIEDEIFRASGAVIVDKGWRDIYHYGWRKPEALPALKKGDVVPVKSVDIDKKMTLPPPRYSQGGLIGLMEKLGIGTKSTRHNILKTLLKRNYISGAKIVEATELGINVIESLTAYANKVTTADMTSELEKEMDQVATGTMKQAALITDSRKLLKDILTDLEKNTASIQKTITKKETIGPCPKCKKAEMEVRKSKRGKRFVGCTGYPACDQTYPLPQKGKLIPLNRACRKCGAPTVKIISKGKSPWVFCVDMGCK
jgi:DNA topoisomerase-1